MDTVFIACAHPSSASALELYLRLRLGFSEVFITRSWDELLAGAAAHPPAWIFFDLELPGLPAAQAARLLRENDPGVVLIAMGSKDFERPGSSLPAELAACLSWLDPPDKIIAVLRQAAGANRPTCPSGQSEPPQVGQPGPSG